MLASTAPGLVKVSLIYNPYKGQRRTDAEGYVSDLVALAPNWGDVRLHQLEFAALDGDMARFDSILALADTASKVAKAWQLTRALEASGDTRTIPTLGADIEEPEVFAYSVGQLDGFFSEPELADELVEYFGRRPEWIGTEWTVGAHLYSGTFDLAQGQWEEGTIEIRRARDINEAWAVEFEALYAGLPGRPDRATALEEAHEALLAWTPSPEDEGTVPFMTVHTGRNDHIREYLLGLTEVWMDRPESADDNIEALINTPPNNEPGRFAQELGLSLRGHQAYAMGDNERALNLLDFENVTPTVPEIVSSPFFVRPHDRLLMADIHLERGEFEEAERWYRSLTEAWDFPYVAAGYEGLANVYAALGQEQEAIQFANRAARRLGLPEGTNRLLDLVRGALDSLNR